MATPLRTSEQSSHLSSFWALKSADDETYYRSPSLGTLDHDAACRFYEASEALSFADDELTGKWNAVEVYYTPAQHARDPLDHYGF